MHKGLKVLDDNIVHGTYDHDCNPQYAPPWLKQKFGRKSRQWTSLADSDGRSPANRYHLEFLTTTRQSVQRDVWNLNQSAICSFCGLGVNMLGCSRSEAERKKPNGGQGLSFSSHGLQRSVEYETSEPPLACPHRFLRILRTSAKENLEPLPPKIHAPNRTIPRS